MNWKAIRYLSDYCDYCAPRAGRPVVAATTWRWDGKYYRPSCEAHGGVILAS